MSTIPILVNNNLQNISYLIYCPHTRECCVIDPLDVQPILSTAKNENLKITTIINTHEHADHTAGNLELKRLTKARVLAQRGADQIIPGFDEGLKQNDIIKIGETIELSVIETPGHTQHSICLFEIHDPAVYTGDSLFNCGCGNCQNGGNLNQLFETFEHQLAHLPPQAKLYPGHNYLSNNMAFVRSIQPDLPELLSLEKRSKGDKLYISTLEEDKSVNPFFRLSDPALIKALHLHETVSREGVFLTLREMRNRW